MSPPTLDQHHATRIVKALLIGNSGSGKTGSLASLVNAGYNLGILDYDNGLDILLQYVDPDKRKNVHYATLTDKMKVAEDGTIFCPGTPRAYLRGIQLLDRWKTEDEDLGNPRDWDESWIIVIDSLTMLGRAIMHHVKSINGAPMEDDWGFYGQSMERQEKVLELLYAADIKCNVIVTAHVVLVAPQKKIEVTNPRTGKTSIQMVDAGDQQQYPSALGNKLPPKVGRYFNAIMRARTVGEGPGAKHVLDTISGSEIELKTPFAKAIPKQLDLGTGLAQYFEIARKTASS